MRRRRGRFSFRLWPPGTWPCSKRPPPRARPRLATTRGKTPVGAQTGTLVSWTDDEQWPRVDKRIVGAVAGAPGCARLSALARVFHTRRSRRREEADGAKVY